MGDLVGTDERTDGQTDRQTPLDSIASGELKLTG